MTRTHDITIALRTLDTADYNVDAANLRARTDLQRILATDPTIDRHQQHRGSSADTTGRPRNATRTIRRFALAGGLVTVVTAGMVMLPSFTGGDQAFASWADVPHGMTAQESTDAANSCRQMHEDGPDGYADELENAVPAVAERRGVWSTVVLAASGGFSALCITDDSSHLFGRDMIGSIGTSVATPPGPRELIATDLGTGTMNAGDISVAVGAAGSDVVGVVYHSRTHGDVAATVSDGHFALWFPGDELKQASSTHGVDVEVTYGDGTSGTSTLML